MRSSTIAVELVRLWAPDNLRRVAPGVALCAVIAAVAFIADMRNMLKFGAVWVPPLILTLVIGMALQPLSARPALKPGLEFAGRTLLRVGVALYGARLTLGHQRVRQVVVHARPGPRRQLPAILRSEEVV